MKVFYLFFGLLVPGFVISMEMESGHARSKRATSHFIRLEPRNATQIQIYLDEHNTPRRRQGASNMQLITWSNELADYAEAHLRTCEVAHSANRATTNYPNIGENLAWTHSGQDPSVQLVTFSIADAVRLWFNEETHYTYDTQMCAVGQQCGHYTQGVWASTYKIGCAKAWCQSRSNPSSIANQTVIISCNYAPAGNIINSTTGRIGVPFLKGPACSACPSGDGCNNGLCTNPVRDAGCHEENPYFSGDGIAPCADLNPCTNGSHNCMFPRGICHNTTLYDYVCNCSSGYREISGMCSVCEPPSAIAFGSFAPQNSNYNVSATVTYSCIKGRVLLGSAIRTCLSNGQWTAPPVCINTCSPPSIAFGSSSISDDINPGQIAAFFCNSGYILVGSPSATCQADGSFSALPTCEPACSPPTPVLNATYTPIQPLYRVNSTVSFTCSAGTQLTGNAVITCQANLTWTAPPRCLRICPSPPAINGSYTPMGLYTEGSVIVYTCFSNYVLWGNSSRTCQPDGQWTPPPTCAPDRCVAGPCLNGGTCQNQNTQVGYICVCTAQYQGQRCENDVNECANTTVSPCPANSICQNLPGSFRCPCSPGYTAAGTSPSHTCVDVNECTTGTASCIPAATCMNTIGSYTCQCPPGSFGDGINTCTFTDFCSGVDCGHGTCQVDTSTFECICQSGFTKNGAGLCTEDINECVTTPTICGNGQCVNWPGSYNCTCDSGWSGAGCSVDIDECAQPQAVCHSNATCTNIPGSFRCACKAGFVGSGTVCYPYILFPMDNSITFFPGRRSRLSFILPIPFGTEYFQSIYLNENGILALSLRRNLNNLRLDNINNLQNTNGIRYISPFHDNFVGGTVKYKLDQSLNGVTGYSSIVDKIRTKFGITMSIKVLLQVEWNDVLIFPDYSFPNQGSTFQCILASDGIETIVFFVYQGGLMKFLPNTMIRSQNNVQIGFFNNLGLSHHSVGNYQPYLSSNTGTLGLYMYQFSATSNNIAKCLAWYNEERLLPPLIPRLNCPWSSAAAGRDTRWIRKESIYSWWNIDPQTAVPPRTTCFQRLWTSGRSPVCCYRRRALWSGPLYSHTQRYQLHPFRTTPADITQYINYEVNPQIHCCTGQALNFHCRLFQQLRPNEFGFFYRPPFFRWGFGDPHIVTIKNDQYTFNGLGEYYIMLVEGSFALQGRTEQAININGTKTQATLFTQIVAKDYLNNNTVEFRAVGNNTVVTMNGVVTTFQDTPRLLNGMTYQRINTTYEVIINANVTVSAFTTGGVLGFSTTSSDVFNNNTRGLIGDFIMRNGTQLNKTEIKISGHSALLNGQFDQAKVFPFGESWRVSMSESLFNYSQGGNYSFYNPSGYVPAFLRTLVDNTNNDTLNSYIAQCGDNTLSCLYDLLLTGNLALSRASGEVTVEATNIHREAVNRLPVVSFSVYGSGPEYINNTLRIMLGTVAGIGLSISDPDGDSTTITVNSDDIPGLATGMGVVQFSPTTFNANSSSENLIITIEVSDGIGSTVVQIPALICNCSGNGDCLWNEAVRVGSSNYGIVSCLCNNSYTGDTCSDDTDGCQGNPCYGNCTDVAAPESGFTCAPCPPNTDGNGEQCTDRDECRTGNHNCEQNCTNVVGSFNCSCRTGYMVDMSNSSQCVNVNECMDPNICNSFGSATCMDTVGSYRCLCNSGFVLNGTVCSDINECDNDTVCDNRTTRCENTVGSYRCQCLTGYSKNSSIASASDPCTNINECTSSPRICSIHSTCNDSDGSFLCTCGFGFRKLTATICEHQLCSNITCAPGLICTEDMQTGIGMCGCRGNQHLFNNTRCLPKFPFVQRTIKAFQEEYNNLTSPEALIFIAEFIRTELPLFRISNIIGLSVTKLSRGSTIVEFEALVGPSSANVTHEELLIEINQAIDSNNFNTSLLIDRPTAVLPNITAGCGAAPAQTSITLGTLQNAVLDSSLSCAPNVVGISFNVCNLTRSGITADRIVIAGPGQDVLNVSASCKPNFIRTSDGQTSATFLLFDILSCGVQAMMTERELRLSYSVRSLPPVAGSAIVQRYYETMSVFNCTFNRTANVDAMIFPKIPTVLFANPAVSGQFQIMLSLFRDRNFTTMFQSGGNSPIVRVSDYIYFKAAVGISGAVLQASQCWATPSNNPNDTIKYMIIESGCPSTADRAAIDVVSNYQSTEVKAGFKSFVWVNTPTRSIYIHCTVSVCLSSVSNCTGPVCGGRKRRDLEFDKDPKIYSVGPVIIETPCDVLGVCDHQCSMDDQYQAVCSCYAGFALGPDGRTCVESLYEPSDQSAVFSDKALTVVLIALMLATVGILIFRRRNGKKLALGEP